ncbi:MAG: tyrosine-type recombinase/integrase [Candidatus Accumulibacter sp.]|nr:tyrosine-type recombinase/integrase [Accumulibacter sp.]
MMDLQRVCEQFLNHCSSAISLSEHTLRAYTGDLKHARKFMGQQSELTSIKKERLRRYIGTMRNEQKLKESTIKRRVACLKLLFKWARQESMLKTNPFDTLNERIRLPKRLPRAIDSADARKLRKTANAPSGENGFDAHCKKAAISLLLETGIRVGELSSIQLEDVSLADRCIKIHGKGNRQRFVYLLSPATFETVSSFLAKRKHVDSQSSELLVNEDGKQLTPPLVRQALCELGKSAGIARHITPHMLRHTCATQWLENGLDIRYVQKLLGHHSISTTEIYTHVSDQSLREALLRANGGRQR